MILVHHLRVGRPIFTLWLIEELGLDYELKCYDRDAKTFRAPPELKQAHPLGKSPVIEDDGLVLSESGAITAYLIDQYDRSGALAPPAADRVMRARYLQWLHYAEGSAVMPLMLAMLAGRERGETKLIDAFAGAEISLHLDYLVAELGDSNFILGDDLSGADIGVAYAISMAKNLGVLGDRPTLAAYLKRCMTRPAFQRAKEKAGA